VFIHLFKFTQFAQRFISEERYFFLKAFTADFYTLHLITLIMIDTNCDPINPVFGDHYEYLSIVLM
jgi:hypothetical protein